MICKNCNNVLPEGTVYCHYCGTAISQEGMHTPQNMAAPSYGLVPENPIYVNGIDGEKQYLRALRTIMGQSLTWSRQGSTHAAGVQGPVDVYKMYLPSGEEYRTLFINMYGSTNSTQPPAGFFFAPEQAVAAAPAYKEVPATVAVDMPKTMPVVEMPATMPVVEEPAVPYAVPAAPAVATPVVKQQTKPAVSGNAVVPLLIKVSPILAAILLVVCIVLFGSMNSLKGELAEAREAAENYQNQCSSLENTVDQLNLTLEQQQQIMEDMQLTVDEYNAMHEVLGSTNLGSASYYFQATEKIIVVRKGDTNRKFTLTAHWRDGGTVDVAYSSPCATVSFDKDTWVKTVQMTVMPQEVGFTVATFSNSEDSNTFSILIVVTE